MLRPNEGLRKLASERKREREGERERERERENAVSSILMQVLHKQKNI